ncbi:MAG: MFS transporter [Burkholderiales bacterium]|nr:MFS transporter [Burkholderiales bacterium]
MRPTASTDPGAARGARALPRSVVALGLVSLCMDTSSELIHALLPLFMATVLGAGMVTIGLVEGVAEAAAAIAKVFSGTLSDYMRRRKPLVVAGYGLAAITKPLFPLAPSVAWVFAARFFDRIGKGIRGAPRDALIADVTPAPLLGAAYGLRQSLDSIGAALGPLAALALVALFASNLRMALWAAVLPAVAAVAILAAGVHEPEPDAAAHQARPPLRLADAARLPFRYWWIVTLGAVLTLARFSQAFLVLRATDIGLPLALAPGVMVVMSGVDAIASYPAGIAADRGHRRALLGWGLAALVAADIALAAATSGWALFAGAALWGLHMGLTQGLLAMLVAAESPAHLRGTAFGVFNLVSGAFLLVASVLAGALWAAFGAAATFIAGAAFTALALAGLLAYRPGRTASG